MNIDRFDPNFNTQAAVWNLPSKSVGEDGVYAESSTIEITIDSETVSVRFDTISLVDTVSVSKGNVGADFIPSNFVSILKTNISSQLPSNYSFSSPNTLQSYLSRSFKMSIGQITQKALNYRPMAGTFAMRVSITENYRANDMLLLSSVGDTYALLIDNLAVTKLNIADNAFTQRLSGTLGLSDRDISMLENILLENDYNKNKSLSSIKNIFQGHKSFNEIISYVSIYCNGQGHELTNYIGGNNANGMATFSYIIPNTAKVVVCSDGIIKGALKNPHRTVSSAIQNIVMIATMADKSKILGKMEEITNKADDDRSIGISHGI